jgi:hypothetical protein
LLLETLENRWLLSGSGGNGKQGPEPPLYGPEPGGTVTVDARTKASDRLIVRFHDGAELPIGLQGKRLLRNANIWAVNVGHDESASRKLTALRRRADVVFASPQGEKAQATCGRFA